MTTDDATAPRPAPLLDFVMDSALCGALASFVLWQSLLVALAALCLVWLLGMTVADHIGA